jgi:hypothetical protein
MKGTWSHLRDGPAVRSRDDVVHASRIHKTRSYSSHRRTSELHINSHHERTTQGRIFEGGTRCFVRALLTAEMRTLNSRVGRWKWGTSNVTGKVDEVVHDGQAQVQSNKVSVLVCAHIRDYADTHRPYLSTRATLSHATPARETRQ